MRDPAAALPSEVATVLYVADVVVARVGCGQSISHLSDAAVHDNVRWVLAQPWLDPPTRRLFELAAASPPLPRAVPADPRDPPLGQGLDTRELKPRRRYFKTGQWGHGSRR